MRHPAKLFLGPSLWAILSGVIGLRAKIRPSERRFMTRKGEWNCLETIVVGLSDFRDRHVI